MKCPQEPHVLHAAREDAWTPALREHVGACEDCAAAASVAPWMERFAKMDVRRHILPDPAVVWLKSQLLKTTTVAQKVGRPMNIVQLICYFAVAAAWTGLLMWKWGAFYDWLATFTPATFIGTSGVMSMPLFFVVLALSSATVMLALHTILADEG